MRGRTVVVSMALHVAVFGVALRISSSRASRRATTVAVVGEKKKVEKKEEKPKPKPKPLVASARPEPARQAPVPSRSAPEPVERPSAPPPVETGLTLGNSDGPGIDVGGPPVREPTRQPSAPGQSTKKTTAPVKREKILAPAGGNPEDDPCAEAPSKPVPVQRSTEIEYTQEARSNGIEGRLVLRITVGPDGAVLSVEVVNAVDPQLDAAAVAAVKTWVFKPAMRCGRPLGGAVFTLARRFELGD